MAAIIHNRGPSAPMIAEWLGTCEQTLYRWFVRFEVEPVELAVRDRDRSGWPSKLSDADEAEYQEAVQPPSEAGYDPPAWMTTLAKQFLEDEVGVEYTQRHAQ